MLARFLITSSNIYWISCNGMISYKMNPVKQKHYVLSNEYTHKYNITTPRPFCGFVYKCLIYIFTYKNSSLRNIMSNMKSKFCGTCLNALMRSLVQIALTLINPSRYLLCEYNGWLSVWILFYNRRPFNEGCLLFKVNTATCHLDKNILSKS